MKKRTSRPGDGLPFPRLLPPAGAFLLGAALGSVVMGKDGATAARLTEALMAGGPSGPALRLLWWDLLWWALVFGAAFLPAGTALCAAALAGKGLLLSLTVTACVGALGTPGWGVAFALVFGSGTLGVAALLLLALQALQPAGRRLHRGRNRPDGVYFLTALLCAGLLGASELMFLYLSPPLARTAAAVFG